MKRYIKARVDDVLNAERWLQEEIAADIVNPEDLDRLARINPKDFMLCYAVACNPNTELKTLKYLADNNARYVRRAVACHPNSDLDILWKLSDDDYDGTLSALVSNPNTPEDILKKIASSDKINAKIDALKRLGFEITNDDFGYLKINGKDFNMYERYV